MRDERYASGEAAARERFRGVLQPSPTDAPETLLCEGCVVLGCGYACLAVGLLVVGARRQRDLERALISGDHVPLRFRTVGVFTAGGVALAVMTVVLVIAQT
jgi:hypothetical protein